MSNIITGTHNSDQVSGIHNSNQYVTVIRYYIPFIMIIIRIGVSCLVYKDSMTSGDMYQVTSQVRR